MRSMIIIGLEACLTTGKSIRWRLYINRSIFVMKRKYTITDKMLGSENVISLLRSPIRNNVLSILKEEADKNEQTSLSLHHFLAPLSIVRHSLDKRRIDILIHLQVHHAIKMSGDMPQKAQRLLGPQIESLLEISPRTELLIATKSFLEGYVFPFPDVQDSPVAFQEGVNQFLNTLVISKTTMPECDFQVVARLVRKAIAKEMERLFFEKRFLRPPIPKKLDEKGMIVKDAFDTILGVITL